MDWLGLPPLTALRAFAALAETGTMGQAGAALNVSHAAVSQQVRALEAHLGLSLLDRTGRRVQLTPEGARLAEALQDGFGGIARCIAELTGQEQERPIQISATPSFASNWLLPRLADFRARHPEVSLMIDPTAQVKPLQPGGIDVALRYGNGDWPGLETSLVVRSPVVVVAAPALVGEGPVGAAQLRTLPWVQELGTSETTDFLKTQGVEVAPRMGITSLPGNLMIEAARAGQAAAVVARALVAGDIAAGRLRILHEDDKRHGYYLVVRPGPQRPGLRAFTAWVRGQARRMDKE